MSIRRRRTAGGGRRTFLDVCAASCAAALLVFVAASETKAATICTRACDPVTPANVYVSGQASLLDVATRFMQRLAALSSYRPAPSTEIFAQAGAAEMVTERYRIWMEGYGLRSRMDAQGDFPGDRRRTAGGVAGVSVALAPGFMAGVSVDQGQTKIDISGGAQNGRINLTQAGLLAGYQNGPWNFGANVVHGFADLHSSRFEFDGLSTAAYQARLWAAMAELTYFWELPNHFRFVPRLTFDWTQSRADAFTEMGGIAPVSGTAVTATRVRMRVGGEIGHSWFVHRTIMDFSVYGLLVDNVAQNFDAIQIIDTIGGSPPQFIAGVRESQLGADAGATLSAKITDVVRLYAVYDGRFRSNFISHSGIIGAEFRF